MVRRRRSRFITQTNARHHEQMGPAPRRPDYVCPVRRDGGDDYVPAPVARAPRGYAYSGAYLRLR